MKSDGFKTTIILSTVPIGLIYIGMKVRYFSYWRIPRGYVYGTIVKITRPELVTIAWEDNESVEVPLQLLDATELPVGKCRRLKELVGKD